MNTSFKFSNAVDYDSDHYTLEYSFEFLGRPGTVEMKQMVLKNEEGDNETGAEFYTITNENGETICIDSDFDDAVEEAERYGYKDESGKESFRDLLMDISFAVTDQMDEYVD